MESTLAQIYKREDLVTGHSYGGPSYYIQTALGQRWLGIIFSVFFLLTYLVGYNLLASYNVQTNFSGYGFYSETKTPIIVGAGLAILFALCVFGGAKKLTKITSYLVPIMSITYIIVALGVIIFNFTNIPSMFATILKDAFSFEAGAGGFAGSCIMYGIKRGLYSNESRHGFCTERLCKRKRFAPGQAGSGAVAFRVYRHHRNLLCDRPDVPFDKRCPFQRNFGYPLRAGIAPLRFG